MKAKEIAESYAEGMAGQRLKEGIIAYARQKCREQRRNCFKVEEPSSYSGDNLKTWVNRYTVLNASEPEFE